MAYFLVAVSTRENLDLCIHHAQAGFTGSLTGVWAFLDIAVGDFLSFLYGARIFNLYRLVGKRAIQDAHGAPPWAPIRFRSGLQYDFPFRLYLEPVRECQESLVRAEFAYIAENLLLRGGYRKTQFQADQTTLQVVSQLGNISQREPDPLDLSPYSSFEPSFVGLRSKQEVPRVFVFAEPILHTLLRRYLEKQEHQRTLLLEMGISPGSLGELEALGEKALPEGHIDILLKEKTPIAQARQIVIEVKKGIGRQADLEQLLRYKAICGPDCVGAGLVAAGFPSSVVRQAKEQGVACASYRLEVPKPWDKPLPYIALERAFTLYLEG